MRAITVPGSFMVKSDPKCPFQEHSQPVMDALHAWFEAQFVEKKVEPNSGLGEALTYFLKRWD